MEHVGSGNPEEPKGREQDKVFTHLNLSLLAFFSQEEALDLQRSLLSELRVAVGQEKVIPSLPFNRCLFL